MPSTIFITTKNGSNIYHETNSTQPEIFEAKYVTLNLLEKLRAKYERIHGIYKLWCSGKNPHKLSKSV